MLGLYLAAMDDSTYETQFVQVYERCKRLVYHTAYQIVQDSYLAEDVLQEVFLHLAQNFTRVYREDKHKMAAYLVICTKSRAIDMLRKRKGAAEDGDGTEYENFADDAHPAGRCVNRRRGCAAAYAAGAGIAAAVPRAVAAESPRLRKRRNCIGA